MAGYLVLAAIMLFAVIEAFRLLGFALLAELTTQFTVFLAQVILGLLLFAIGLFLANLAARAIRASQVAHSSLLAQIARLALLILAGAMALQLMGFAPEVISIAFGLLLGAVMLASALAFGLGGRETAGRLLQRWVESKQGGSPEK